MRDIIRSLVDAVEPSTTTPEAIEAALVPIASNPELRNRVLELRAAHDRIIDEVSTDELIEAGGGVVDTGKARTIVESWTAYLDEHRDEITALQLGGYEPASGASTSASSRVWPPELPGHHTIGRPTSSGTPMPPSTARRCTRAPHMR